MILRDAQALPFRFRVFQVRFGPRPCRCLAAVSQLPRGTAPWERELSLSSLCLGEKQSAGTAPAKPVARTECLTEREARARIQNNWAPMCQGWHGVGRSEALILHS